MQRSTLPPPHPSLPLHPTALFPSSYASGVYPAHQYQQPPTSYAYPAYYSSHYAQAYSQAASTSSAVQCNSDPIEYNGNRTCVAQGTSSRGPNFSAQAVSSWYQPGNNRCSLPGCAFTGSHKSVEVHMMDRHLIYPPGWGKRKKSDWDADPSLKGKPIPIQGTNVILDSPDVLEAWIAERKKRFPTSARVEDKKRKMEEAVARGQLDMTDTGMRANKRRKVEPYETGAFQRERPGQFPGTRGKNGSGKDVGYARVPDAGWPRRTNTDKAVSETSKKVISPSADSVSDDSGDEDDDDDGDEPDILSSKVSMLVESSSISETTKQISRVKPNGESISIRAERKDPERPKKNLPLHPRGTPRNPFASRPTLLRNLLLPEIRVTVSNLSQAIRFLVDNDFLRDVEIKPGQAAEQHKIQVLAREEDTKQHETLSSSAPS